MSNHISDNLWQSCSFASWSLDEEQVSLYSDVETLVLSLELVWPYTFHFSNENSINTDQQTRLLSKKKKVILKKKNNTGKKKA